MSERRSLAGRILVFPSSIGNPTSEDTYRASLALNPPADEQYWKAFYHNYFDPNQIDLPLDPRYPFLEPSKTAPADRPQMRSWQALVKYLMEPPNRYQKYFRYLSFGLVHRIGGFDLDSVEPRYKEQAKYFLFNILNYEKEKWVRAVCAQGLVEVFSQGILRDILAKRYHSDETQLLTNPNPNGNPHHVPIQVPHGLAAHAPGKATGQRPANQLLSELVCVITRNFYLFDLKLAGKNLPTLSCSSTSVLTKYIYDGDTDLFKEVYQNYLVLPYKNERGIKFFFLRQAIIYGRAEITAFMMERVLEELENEIPNFPQEFYATFLTPATLAVLESYAPDVDFFQEYPERVEYMARQLGRTELADAMTAYQERVEYGQ